VKRLSAFLNKPDFGQVSYEKKQKLTELLSEARESFEKILEETEIPLLVAAGVGLAAVVPAHDARIDIQEAIKTLKAVAKRLPEGPESQAVGSALAHMQQADDIVGNITKVLQKPASEETFEIGKPIELAESLFKYRMERRNIEFHTDIRTSFTIQGSSRQIAILLVNMLDNSTYWLQQMPLAKREIRIIADKIDGRIKDPIDVITLPFVTTKPNGMGLGLYIADRIAANHSARLRLLSQADLPGLLSGANIAVVFPFPGEVVTQKARVTS
jgi:signal transduction histidine kinase